MRLRPSRRLGPGGAAVSNRFTVPSERSDPDSMTQIAARSDKISGLGRAAEALEVFSGATIEKVD